MMSADNDEVLGNDAKGSSSQDLRKLSHVKVHCVCGRPDAYIRPPRTEGSEGEEFPVKAKRRVFGLLVVLNIAVQYDTGALAATISDTSDKGVLHEFGLSQGELGLLVSVAHLGVAAGCLLCGPSLQRYPARHLLRGATLVNTVTALLFAFSPTYWLLIASRVLNGLSQAFLIVFAPMWTDEFAPESSKSTWMAASEAGGPIGIVIGYLMSGLFLANTSLSWRYPFYIQAFCLLVLTVLGFFVKAHHLQVQQLDKCTRSKPRPSECPTKRCRVIEVLHEGNSRSPSTVVTVTPPMDTPRKMSWAVHTAELDNEDKPSDALEGETTCSCILCQPEQCQSDYRQRACSFCVEEEPAPPPESKLYAWWVVATNGQVWAALMALSSLYFVVTGLQMWVTAYLTDDTGQIRANPNTVIICFGCSAATAPVLGVVIGGIVLDKAGGYHGEMHRAAGLACGFGVFACIAAFVALAARDFVLFIVMIWILLFLGGGAVIALMGIIVAAVEKNHRCVCLSFVKLISTVLGYFLGPLVCGVVADLTSLEWGFRVVLGSTTISELLLILTFAIAYTRQQDRPAVDLETEDPKLVRRLRSSVFALIGGSGVATRDDDAERDSAAALDSTRKSFDFSHKTFGATLATLGASTATADTGKAALPGVPCAEDADAACTTTPDRGASETLRAWKETDCT